MRTTIQLLLIGAGGLVACGAGDGNGPDKGAITLSQGDGQTATVGTQLAPYQVLVTDGSGAPQAGVKVAWSITTGGGSLSGSSSRSDASGIASIQSTLGTSAGAQSVRANAPGYTGAPVTFTSTGTPGPAASLQVASGNGQGGPAGVALGSPLQVLVRDAYGNGVPGATVTWSVEGGGGTLAGATSTSNASGQASMSWTLGAVAGGATASAVLAGLDTAEFHATVKGSLTVLSGGNNVPERFGSDLWVANGYAYTGTWNHIQRTAGVAGVIKVFQLDGTGAPALVDSVNLPTVNTVSDLEVSADGQWLVVTAEGGSGQGLYVYSLANPAKPVQVAYSSVSAGLHTGSLATIGGTLYAFGAKNPSSPALMIFDLSAAGSGTITVASSTPIPPNYGIHDTFIRDGICFTFVWNEGVYIYDVGNGSRGGSPTAPVLISQIQTQGGQAHNGWWFWNPKRNEKKYLFVGEEGPGSVGASSSGDIHVVDVSDLSAPVEIGRFTLPGAGTHNFWMDEAGERLYAAYYNGGVVALDVGGADLTGSLAARQIATIKPGGGGNTYVWGVQLEGNSLYVVDMLSGLWQLQVP